MGHFPKTPTDEQTFEGCVAGGRQVKLVRSSHLDGTYFSFLRMLVDVRLVYKGNYLDNERLHAFG